MKRLHPEQETTNDANITNKNSGIGRKIRKKAYEPKLGNEVPAFGRKNRHDSGKCSRCGKYFSRADKICDHIASGACDRIISKLISNNEYHLSSPPPLTEEQIEYKKRYDMKKNGANTNPTLSTMPIENDVKPKRILHKKNVIDTQIPSKTFIFESKASEDRLKDGICNIRFAYPKLNYRVLHTVPKYIIPPKPRKTVIEELKEKPNEVNKSIQCLPKENNKESSELFPPLLGERTFKSNSPTPIISTADKHEISHIIQTERIELLKESKSTGKPYKEPEFNFSSLFRNPNDTVAHPMQTPDGPKIMSKSERRKLLIGNSHIIEPEEIPRNFADECSALSSYSSCKIASQNMAYSIPDSNDPLHEGCIIEKKHKVVSEKKINAVEKSLKATFGDKENPKKPRINQELLEIKDVYDNRTKSLYNVWLPINPDYRKLWRLLIFLYTQRIHPFTHELSMQLWGIEADTKGFNTQQRLDYIASLFNPLAGYLETLLRQELAEQYRFFGPVENPMPVPEIFDTAMICLNLGRDNGEKLRNPLSQCKLFRIICCDQQIAQINIPEPKVAVSSQDKARAMDIIRQETAKAAQEIAQRVLAEMKKGEIEKKEEENKAKNMSNSGDSDFDICIMSDNVNKKLDKLLQDAEAIAPRSHPDSPKNNSAKHAIIID